MGNINLKNLTTKLNSTCRKALEEAAGLCLTRTHYYVELEHWLIKLFEQSAIDCDLIAVHFNLDAGQIIQEFNHSLEQQKTGNSRPPALSQIIVDLITRAWLVATLEFGAQNIRSGHLIYALLQDEQLQRVMAAISPTLAKLSLAELADAWLSLAEKSAEQQTEQSASLAQKSAGSGKTPALDQYTIDLTAQAKQDQIDPIIGRSNEIYQVVNILLRRRQNNPILVGEPGVGKTAVAEGFARLIANDELPEALRGISLRTLDMGLLQAGAGIKGEFEQRLKAVIDEVKSSPTPIILFIDEAHTLVGANGQNDAANLMKPALARGELRTIAATTWQEYKKYFEQDAALTRRFQVVHVQEPDEPTAVNMIQGLVPYLQRHHRVNVLSNSVNETVKLSMRYISGRQLPDKAVSLLDTACARVAVSQTTLPPVIENWQARIQELNTKLNIIQNEIKQGFAHKE